MREYNGIISYVEVGTLINTTNVRKNSDGTDLILEVQKKSPQLDGRSPDDNYRQKFVDPQLRILRSLVLSFLV
jgi:hypothetical protein